MLRDRDSSAYTQTTSGTLDERRYICQNWRADTVAVLGPTPTGSSSGDFHVRERIKYDAYGRPRHHPLADYDHDEGVTIDDENAFLADFDVGSGRADANFDGGVTIDDLLLYIDNFDNGGLTFVRGLYAGYQLDDALAGSGRTFYTRAEPRP